jgi:stage III sporulation protein AB
MRGIGAAAVMLASVVIGVLSVRQSQKHLLNLRELEDALLYLTAELAEKQSPLPELIKTGCIVSSGEAKLFFRDLYERLSRLGDKSFYELWEDAVRQHYAMLAEGERRELLALGRQLGRAALQRQLAACERCTRFLASARESGESLYVRERRMRLALPAAMGGLLLILLL